MCVVRQNASRSFLSAPLRPSCGLKQHHLARETLALSRCIPLACGSSRALSPSRASRPYRRPAHSQGDFALSVPIDPGAFLPPRPLTISWRPTLRGLDTDQVSRDPIPTTKQGSFRAALSWNHPIDQGARQRACPMSSTSAAVAPSPMANLHYPNVYPLVTLCR